jgi:hypothetical protein
MYYQLCVSDFDGDKTVNLHAALRVAQENKHVEMPGAT